MTATEYGYPCWMDMESSDLATSMAFYAALFDWQPIGGYENRDNYHLIGPEGTAVAAVMDRKSSETRDADAWNLFFRVGDAQQVLDAAVEHGGQVLVPVTDNGPSGLKAAAVDPRGNPFWLWQAKDFPGYHLDNRYDFPCWAELSVFDIEHATQYFGDVLGLRMSEERAVDEDAQPSSYRILYAGGGAVVDVMDIESPYRQGIPRGWTIFVGTKNVDASLAKAVELGGSVIRGAIDSPWGRWALFADPTGAHLAIIEHSDELLAAGEARGS